MADEAVIDSPELEVPDLGGEPEEHEESAEPIEGEPEEHEESAEEEIEEPAEGDKEGDKEEVAADGRKMPDSLKKAIASLKATSPEAAKEIKGLFFANQEYRQVFAKPADAVAAKTLIDEIGGQEGIQEIQAEREEWNQLDSSFAEGKPEFVKGLAEGNPEAFIKTAPHVINEFAARAPEQYQYYANTVSLNTLAAAGLSIDNLARAYGSYADNPQAQAIIAEIHNSLVGLKEKTTQFEQKRTDPREEQLRQRETQFEQRRRADFEGSVADKAESFLKDKMQPEIDRIVAGRKVDPDAMKGYQKMVDDEVKRMLGEIPGFSDKLEANYRTGDSAKSLTYITGHYNRILPIAAKVIEPFLRNIGAGPKPVVKGPDGKPVARTTSPGEIVLKDMPDWDKFDQSKTSVADVMQGFGVLKNGKRASGWS